MIPIIERTWWDIVFLRSHISRRVRLRTGGYIGGATRAHKCIFNTHTAPPYDILASKWSEQVARAGDGGKKGGQEGGRGDRESRERATKTKEDVVGGRLRREPSRPDMWEKSLILYARTAGSVLRRSITSLSERVLLLYHYHRVPPEGDPSLEKNPERGGGQGRYLTSPVSNATFKGRVGMYPI